MEELDEFGKPKDKSYLEAGLSDCLRKSIAKMNEHWQILDSGKEDLRWDLYWYDLMSDINSAEVEQEITSEQAKYLREKYLRMKGN